MAAKKSKPRQTGIKDRLSALPDAILCHMLSFLPTKNAVVTSLLSTRWKYLYRSVPKIDLDDYLPMEAAQRKCSEKTSNGFIRFTNRMFSLRNSANIATFYLRCSNTYEDWIINDWICAALCRNVQELDIHVEYPAGDHLTGEIFRHERLSSLKLHGFSVKVPEQELVDSGSLSKLECLTDLDLSPRSEDDFRMLPRLLDGTPNLERLTLGMAFIGEFGSQGIVSDLFEVKPLCLAQKLRKVDIFDFADSETQFNMVEYLLQHGALLELMSFQFVTTKTPEKWPFSMLRRLLMFPRCSKACKIALVE